jgi:crotonobetainyl-CoA:carnitine CoA-transferase CaiB-like acyl-CoA transferase
MHGLDLHVVDLSSGIAGGYCSKLLTDAGADVVKVEPPAGDPLRRWSAGAAARGELLPEGQDGALFRFLHHGQRSVVGEPGQADADALIASADLVIEDGRLSPERIDALRTSGVVVISITPFGRAGIAGDRPATEFTVQAESGALIGRGVPERPPFMCGGRVSEWVSGTFASVAALAACRGAARTGHGEHVDFSMAELMTIAGANYADAMHALMGRPPLDRPARTQETPSIEPTLDGYVGVNTNTQTMFEAFLLMIERPELMIEDPSWAMARVRNERFEEWNRIVHEWTTKHPTEEIVALASSLRIPVAYVNSGATVQDSEHFKARGVFVDDPTGTFRMPRRPWQLDFERPPAPRPAPALGEHTDRVSPWTRQRTAPTGPPELPLAGVRVLDLTAWWAGPSSCHLLACLGADVIHVESTQRIDNMRLTGGMFAGAGGDWWEKSSFFMCVNTNKRGLTLDLTSPTGRDLFLRLVEQADVVVENFTPRVMDNFDLGWDVIHAANPRAILVRMPAFGLDGPWRDNSGFAQTMEQMTGLAWVTGFTDDQPRIQRGPSDPNAGMHAAFATIVALAERDRTGTGHHLEVVMVEGALNAASELVIEYTAYGNLIERDGNHSPGAAPQGVYECGGREQWLAVSVTTDEQWRGLVAALGSPVWATDPGLATAAGRAGRQDELDAALATWAADRDLDATVELLLGHGVPAARACDPRLTSRNPVFGSRGFYEDVDHPVVGLLPIPTVPFRFASVDTWIRTPAPTLGQHNAEILHELLGLGDAELAELEAAEVIGTRPKGM